MGVLKDVINSLDPAPDEKKEITLALNLLFELANQKKEIQSSYLKEQLRTAGTQENPTIPVTSILQWHDETRAYVKDDAAHLVDTVTGAVRKFITGGTDEIISGIGDLLSAGLEAILGSGSGTESEMHSYFIIVEGLSIVRFDLCAWQRKIEVTGITSKMENAMTMTAVKSSVDVDKITFNTFLQAYKVQLQNMDIPESELIAYIKKAKEVFELLRDPSSDSQALVEKHVSFKNPTLIEFIKTP